MRLPRYARNDDEYVGEVVEVLKNGGVVIFPTDTVWGVGAWIESEEGLKKLYEIKKRDERKPTAILVGSMEQAGEYGEFSGQARGLVDKYWPGAMTVIVKNKNDLPKEVLNIDGGVGIRLPDSDLIQQICLNLGGGMVASSANMAGGVAPVKISDVNEKLIQEVDLVIDEDVETSGVSSTVVDCIAAPFKILRQGSVEI